MTKTVIAEWNFDLEEGKKQGIVLVIGKNSDGSRGVGYATWDLVDNVWVSPETMEPMPNFTVKAWMKDTSLLIDLD